MTCMKIKRREYLPFFLVAVIVFLYHALMKPMGGDDVFFSQATATQSLWSYLSQRYEIWTSRVILEFLLVTIIKLPILWRILNFLALATLPILIARLFDRSELMNWCAAGAVLLYPFHDMGTAGWITTTVTHFWPLWGFFYLCYLLKKVYIKEKVRWVEAIFGIFVCVMTSNHEQWAVIFFAVLIMYGFLLWKEKRRPTNLFVPVSLAMVNVVSLVVILFCPGNAARNLVSIHDLPIYAEFGFGDKLYLGLLSIERVFIANADAVFLAVLLIWTLLVYLKTNHYVKTLLAGLPLLILFGQTVVRTAYPGLSGIFVMPGEVLEWSWGDLSTWIPMVYLVITLCSMCYSLYLLIGENILEYIYSLLFLGLGFGAGAVVGFMATIYVSGERVYAALYLALMCVTLFCIYRMKAQVQEKIQQTSGKLVATVLAVLCLVNIGFITLSL